MLNFVGSHGYLNQHLPQCWMMHDHRRLGTALLTNKITWPNTMQFFLVGICYDSLLSTSSTIGSACAAKMNHHCHLRNWFWHAAVGLSGKGLSAWCLPYHKDGHIQHLCGTKKKKLGEFLFPFLGRTLQSSSPFNYTNFMKRVGEFWTLHMFQMLLVFSFFVTWNPQL